MPCAASYKPFRTRAPGEHGLAARPTTSTCAITRLSPAFRLRLALEDIAGPVLAIRSGRSRHSRANSSVTSVCSNRVGCRPVKLSFSTLAAPLPALTRGRAAHDARRGEALVLRDTHDAPSSQDQIGQTGERSPLSRQRRSVSPTLAQYWSSSPDEPR